MHGDQKPEHDDDEYIDVFYRYDAEHREVSCYATTCDSPYYDGDGMIRVSVGSWEEFLLDLRGLLHESDRLYPDKKYPCVIVSAALPSSYALPYTYRCRIERVAPTPIDPKAFAGSTDYDCEAGCCGCMCD